MLPGTAEDAEFVLLDPVDHFEDRLAELLGMSRPPSQSYPAWRSARVNFIRSADQDRADELAAVVEEELTGRPVERDAYTDS